MSRRWTAKDIVKLGQSEKRMAKVIEAMKKPKGPSRLESAFASIWSSLSGPALIVEHQFHPTRKWRFDYAHASTMIAIEIEGGIWSGGRHTRGEGYAKDCEKYNAAVHLGWRVFRITRPNTAELQQIIDTINRT